MKFEGSKSALLVSGDIALQMRHGHAYRQGREAQWTDTSCWGEC